MRIRSSVRRREFSREAAAYIHYWIRWSNHNWFREYVPPPGSVTEEGSDDLLPSTSASLLIPYEEGEGPAHEYFYISDMTDEYSESLAELLYRAIYIKNYGMVMWKFYWKSLMEKKWRSRKRFAMKPCTHVKKRYKNRDKTLLLNLHRETPVYWEQAYNGANRHWVSKHSFQIQVPSLIDTVLPSTEFESPFSRVIEPMSFFHSDLAHRCQEKVLKHALPNLEDGFSLPVFVGELKDIPGMLKHATSLVANAPSKLKALFKTPFRQWSEHQLAVSFGWLPFVRDIETLIDRLLNVRADVLEFMKEAGKRRTYHYTIRLDAEDIGKPPDWFDLDEVCEKSLTFSTMGDTYSPVALYLQGVDFKVKRQRSLSNLMYTGTIDYSYSLTDLGQWGPILAGLDRFGLNVSPSDVWELVPFSFLVDWFFNVQSLVKRFDQTNLPAQLVINEYCESLKYGYAEHFVYDDVSPTFTSFGNSMALGQAPNDWVISPISSSSSYIEDVYYRRVCTPHMSRDDFPEFTLPHGMQIVLGTALVGTRM